MDGISEIGEVRKGTEVGWLCHNKVIWHACIDCGRARWVMLERGKPQSLRCSTCANRLRHRASGPAHYRWKGRFSSGKDGYMLVHLEPHDFFYPMTDKKGLVLEHRLVVAKALNRCLLPWEVVHHKGKKYPLGSIENKQDNRYPENLELLPTKKYHLVDTVTQSHLKRLQLQVDNQAKEIRLLKWLIRELNKREGKICLTE